MKIRSLIILLSFAYAGSVIAQDAKDDDGSNAAQANNPLANMTALNFHNYYMAKLNDAPDGSYMNTGWIRFARPFAEGRLLLRASIPLSTIALPDANRVLRATSGLGDINAFLSYNFVSKPTATMGIGPMLTAPTASEDQIGSGMWQGGFAFVAFIAKSPVFQFGGLVTWQASFAGDSDRSATSVAAIQPFYFWQLVKGTYLRGAPIWAFDLKNDAYSVPLALGIGKVVKLGTTVFNLFVEPQYSLLIDGTQPQVQIFTGINLQFTK
jgi:hypothetical protein